MNAPMAVQIYIPVHLQERLKEARLYFKENEVDALDTTLLDNSTDKDPNVITISKAELSKGNAIYLPMQSTLSGVGLLGLVREGKDKPESQDEYKFAINFAKKEEIHYRIRELGSGKYITVEFIHPRLYSPLEIKIAGRAGRKPLYESDFNSDDAVVKGKDGKPYIITLTPVFKSENYVYKKVFVNEANKKDYRVTFVNKKDSENYFLVDESEITIEEKKNKMGGGFRHYRAKPSEKLCPYCGEPLFDHATKSKSLIKSCSGFDIQWNYVVDKDGYNFYQLYKPEKGKMQKHIVCIKAYHMAKEQEPDIEGLIAGYQELPPDILSKNTMNVIMAGFPKSGKTIFLSSLFNFKGSIGIDNAKTSQPHVLNNIVRTFDKKRQKGVVKEATEIVVPTIKLTNTYKDINVQKENLRRYSEKRNYTRERYLFDVNVKIESQTAADKEVELSWNPIGYRMGSLGNIFFYDLPGEVFKNETYTKARSFKMANSIIAIIDGEKVINDGNPLGELDSSLEKLTKYYKNHGMDASLLRELPIAIVFTKMDTFFSDYSKSKHGLLDSNCLITKEDFNDVLPKNGHYRHSNLERHIDVSSYEIEHLLRQSEGAGSKTIKDIKVKYRNIKFFAVSSLGADNVLSSDVPGAKMLDVNYEGRRLRMELPIIWLMYQTHLIKR